MKTTFQRIPFRLCSNNLQKSPNWLGNLYTGRPFPLPLAAMLILWAQYIRSLGIHMPFATLKGNLVAVHLQVSINAEGKAKKQDGVI